MRFCVGCSPFILIAESALLPPGILPSSTSGPRFRIILYPFGLTSSTAPSVFFFPPVVPPSPVAVLTLTLDLLTVCSRMELPIDAGPPALYREVCPAVYQGSLRPGAFTSAPARRLLSFSFRFFAVRGCSGPLFMFSNKGLMAHCKPNRQVVESFVFLQSFPQKQLGHRVPA